MRTKINSLSKLREWIKTHRIQSLIIASVVLIVAAAGTALLIVAKNPVVSPSTSTTPPPKKEEPKPVFYAPLTGLEVSDEAAAAKPVTAIMIENSPDARPQSGIKNSAVVY